MGGIVELGVYFVGDVLQLAALLGIVLGEEDGELLCRLAAFQMPDRVKVSVVPS